MIDTDKYTGHTKGPWKNADGNIFGHNEHIADTVLNMVIPQDEAYANTQLIADAPLLLAEVERHKPPKVDGKYMAWSDSHLKHDRRTWIEQVMEGITDVGYWTWVNWQLQYGDEEE